LCDSTGGEKMESLTKINFQHECDSFTEAIGLSDDEAHAIADKLDELFEVATTLSHHMELAVKEFSGSHLLFAIFLIGCNVGKRSISPADILGAMFG
jgi:hypothetical protein